MSKIKIIFLLFMIASVVGGVIYFFFFRATPTSVPLITVTESTNQVTPPKRTETPVTPKQTAPFFGTANFESENFRVGDVAIGGESEFLLTEDTPDPLTITEIRGEAFTEKNKPEVRLIITWKTNKLAKSEISYSKGAGQPQRVINEADHTTSHNLIIPGLEQGATYLYTIVSRDRYGNEVTSDQHALYTGTKTVSLFDLISNAVSDVFGWAIPQK